MVEKFEDTQGRLGLRFCFHLDVDGAAIVGRCRNVDAFAE